MDLHGRLVDARHRVEVGSIQPVTEDQGEASGAGSTPLQHPHPPARHGKGRRADPGGL